MAAPEGDGEPDTGDGPEVGFDVKERAMDEAPVGITISDPDRPDNPVVYINDAFERVTGYPREEVLGLNCRFLQGEETDNEAVAELARAIDNEEAVTVELLNYRKDGEEFWNEVTVAPVENEDGEVTNFVGFQADVTERKRAQLEVKRERENLQHLLDRIHGLLGDVTTEVVNARDRDELERRVCDRVVEADPYSFVWIGEVDLAGETIRAKACSGGDEQIESFSVSMAETDHPAVKAIETGEVQVVQGDVPAPAAVGAVNGAAAVPLVYRDSSYGVIVIYTPESGAFDDREISVLEALGRTIATALHAHESRRIISTNDIVEIELAVRDRGLFFVDLSARLDAEFEYRGSVYRDGTHLVFFTTDAPADEVLETASDIPEIERVAPVGRDEDASLFEFEIAMESIVAELADRGGRIQSLEATDGVGRIEVELPASADARAFIEYVQDRYTGTDLVGYHETDRPPKTRREFIADLESKLTDRQLTALKKAYLSGYFDWNRTTTGDELAESMDISRSTFHQHLRAAERKLIEEFFERTPN